MLDSERLLLFKTFLGFLIVRVAVGGVWAFGGILSKLPTEVGPSSDLVHDRDGLTISVSFILVEIVNDSIVGHVVEQHIAPTIVGGYNIMVESTID